MPRVDWYFDFVSPFAYLQSEQLAKLPPGVDLRYPRQANSVFLGLTPAVREALHGRGWHFYDFIGWGGARLMCSWDTTEEDVRSLARDLAEVSAPPR